MFKGWVDSGARRVVEHASGDVLGGVSERRQCCLCGIASMCLLLYVRFAGPLSKHPKKRLYLAFPAPKFTTLLVCFVFSVWRAPRLCCFFFAPLHRE